jgi:hypothetical protein
MLYKLGQVVLRIQMEDAVILLIRLLLKGVKDSALFPTLLPGVLLLGTVEETEEMVGFQMAEAAPGGQAELEGMQAVADVGPKAILLHLRRGQAVVAAAVIVATRHKTTQVAAASVFSAKDVMELLRQRMELVVAAALVALGAALLRTVARMAVVRLGNKAIIALPLLAE